MFTDSEISAMRVWAVNGWRSIDDVEICSGEDIESSLIRKDLYQKLSDDSKALIELLFNSDDRVINRMTTPKTGRITQTSLTKFLLKEAGVNLKQITKCFKELRTLAGNL